MQFNSIDFMMFFPVVVAIYYIIPHKFRAYWLLVSSYVFYMSWNTKYALLIGFSTIITYLGGLALSVLTSNESEKNRRLIVMIMCISINLGILALFKYVNFGISNINRILSILGFSTIEKRFELLLPVGISFYTFQALGYLVDVYRGDIKAEKNLFRYALFVSFFPQLVAGPIERSRNLLLQMNDIEHIKLWNARRVASGAILMIWGLFMKMVIADRASILVDTVFDNYLLYGGTELVIAALLFAIQIYCDFGSYSLIAIGAAQIMGFELMENFNTPYFAENIRDFWNRWHISLSTWFRDYLYIPLGGNRNGRIKKYINIIIVFLVSGLWHGAAWNYVAWGGLHGLYQVIGELMSSYKERARMILRIKTDCFSWKFLKMLATFVMVVFAWIFFRSDSITDALRIIKRILTKPTPWVFFNGELYNLGLDRNEWNILAISIVILFLVDLIRIIKGMTIDGFLFSQNIWFEWMVIIALIMMILTFGEYGSMFDGKQFIYFQF